MDRTAPTVRHLESRLQTRNRKERLIFFAASIAVVFGCVLAIVSTYDRVAQTIDEPNHISTGLEWLQDGTYTMWTENPPLARVALSMGPYLAGTRLPEEGRSVPDLQEDSGISYVLGLDVLYENGDFRRQLTLARLGNLFFFLLAAAILWFWLGRDSPLSGFLAVTTLCTLPPILAHSALATTDIAFSAMFLLFIWRFVRWLQDSTRLRSAVVGVCLGLAVATKFTTIVFIPVAVLTLAAARVLTEWRTATLSWKDWRSRALNALLIATPLGLLVTWAAYGFSIGRISELPSQVHGWAVFGSEATGLRGALINSVVDVPIPAPEFFHGVSALLAHNDAGHSAYALGNVSPDGFWYFYPLALLVKTPLPFMLLCGVGVITALWRAKETSWWIWGVLGTIPMILVALFNSHVNIGLRHVLAVYGLASVGVAATVASTLDRLQVEKLRLARLSVVLLLTWQVAATAFSFPGFLTYFNPIAGSDPAEYLVDSDLDWGQGLYELEKFFSQHEVDSFYFAYFGTAKLCEYDLPEIQSLDANTPVGGWVAVSEMYYRNIPSTFWAGPLCDWDAQYAVERSKKGWFEWLREHEPVAVLDRSIRVYRLE